MGRRARRRRLRRERWRRAIWARVSRLRFGEMRPIRAHGRTIHVLTDDLRAHTIARAGGTQPEKVAVWLALAGTGPELCLDIGANYGEFTAPSVDLGIPTLCIEANANLLPCLERTFAGVAHVTLVHAAVSDEDRQVGFHFDRRYSGTGSLAREVPAPSLRNLTGRDGKVERSEVPARRLDSIVQEHLGRWPRSWIAKVDVEGFEVPVLEGSRGLREHAASWRMMLEYNPLTMERVGQRGEEIWKHYAGFPGRILRGVDAEASDLRADERLPDSPPDVGCEVLIGEGFGEAAADR